MATVFILEPSTQHQPSSSSWRPDTRYFLCVATLTLLFFCRNWPRLLCHFKEEFWRHNQTVYIAAPSTQTRSSPAGGQVNIYISTISTISTYLRRLRLPPEPAPQRGEGGQLDPLHCLAGRGRAAGPGHDEAPRYLPQRQHLLKLRLRHPHIRGHHYNSY